MLTAVIQEIKNAKNPVTIRQISRALDIDEQVVEGMILTLVQKGVVRDHARYLEELQQCGAISGCKGCSQYGCALAKNMPKAYSFARSRKGQADLGCP